MNRLAVLVVAWVALGLELGFRAALSVRAGGQEIAPSFVMPLAVLIAVQAPAALALWACFLLGLALDLTNPVEVEGAAGTVRILGPWALGYLLAGHLIVTMRAVLIHRNPISIAVLSGMGAAVAGIVFVAIRTLRRVVLDDPTAWAATAELLSRLGDAVYTALLALVLSLVLLPLAPFMGLHGGGGRRFARRG